MATVENGTYTGYTYDGDNILAEYNKDDSRTTRYIRGYDLISQKKDAGETYHYLHNAHGDITKLVDTAGNVQNSYSYDAFGNTTSYSEKVGNKFRYAGEQYDSTTGEYYLRARYYDPAMGRFMNEDTYKGQIENPQSMNLYAYCENDPINAWDPTGRWKCTDSKYSTTVQVELLKLTVAWYMAGNDKEKSDIHKRANQIRKKVNHGIGRILDRAKSISGAAADEFSWFLGGDVSRAERDYWLTQAQKYDSSISIDEKTALNASMFIIGMLSPSPDDAVKMISKKALKQMDKEVDEAVAKKF